MGGKLYNVRVGDFEHELEVISFDSGHLLARIDGQEFEAECRLISADQVRLEISGRSEYVRLAKLGNTWQVAHRGCHLQIESLSARRGAAGRKTLPAEVTPPMPATVVKVLTQPGQQVSRGQTLLVVSAMKMEVALKSPKDRIVREVLAREGDQVSPGQVLVTFEEEQDAGK